MRVCFTEWMRGFWDGRAGCKPAIRQIANLRYADGAIQQSGVALVMTLIMLSVITVVAVAFLALSQRERTSVTQSTQQSDAEIMADVGLERAKAEIMARILAGNTNLNAVDLLVSLNYIRTNGFVSGQTVPVDPLNVNYEYRQNGGALSAAEREQNIANLYYDPRVPVFVDTNLPGTAPALKGPLEFRFYVDLNRNGRFETNGCYPIIDANGQVVPNTEYHFVGDLEWVGVLENPLAPHSRTNRFIGRYAFIVLPIGKSLDANFIFNHAKSTAAGVDGFLRNQGVGPWEINLAAFLADLNTNYWGTPNDYFYNTNLAVQSSGLAFQDALEIFTRRFGSYQNLAPAQQLFGVTAANFNDGFIDHYSDGPLYITAATMPPVADDDLLKLNARGPWPGSFANAGTIPRTNFFTPHDFFEAFLPGSPFTNRLRRTTFDTSSYDRYTFYRMLAQLSTDSASELPFANIPQLQSKISASNVIDFVAEPAGKINLNYNNLDFPVTAMVPWSAPVTINGVTVAGADRFFNAVADVLLRSQFRFGVSNIYVTNYNVTVHRLLQVAANIHETLQNSSNAFPAIFRPNVITDGQGRKLISGYTKTNDYLATLAWLPTSEKIPMVVGAKKGFPNFNEYVAETIVSAARKLELRRSSTNSGPNETNEMFIIDINNRYALEAWNSYTNMYSNRLDIAIVNRLYLSITNTEGYVFETNDVFTVDTNYARWPGLVRPDQIGTFNTPSFKVPLLIDFNTLSNGIYRPGSPGSIEPVGDTNNFVANSGFHTPEWNLTVSNDLVFILRSGNTMIDFVHLFLTNTMGLSTNFFNVSPRLANEGAVALCWNTNRRGNSLNIFEPTFGVLQQLDISLGQVQVGRAEWTDYANFVGDHGAAITNFLGFVFPQTYPTHNSTNLIQQAPFTPARKMVISARWEVNDPLVHYMEDNLKGLTNNYSRVFVRPFTNPALTNQSLWEINNLYRPWGGRPGKKGADPTDLNWGLKDPGVSGSDSWGFPTNEVPSVGWLGRIHRGTPWQTVYMKAGMASEPEWSRFSLDPLSHPTNDWRLVDVFTTAVHPNASHGQLSINQTNFAAWSAVLSGVIVLDDITTPEDILANKRTFEPKVIGPNSPEVITLYEAIQKRRDQMPDKVFRRLGELLSVPELTRGYTNGVLANSPYITPPAIPSEAAADEVWERIPQQILSLLKVGDPRYVIYSWGQSLRPAEDSILSSGPYMGMCTNYQVTGEFVTRTVFQIEGTAGQPRPTVKAFNILSAD